MYFCKDSSRSSEGCSQYMISNHSATFNNPVMITFNVVITPDYLIRGQNYTIYIHDKLEYFSLNFWYFQLHVASIELRIFIIGCANLRFFKIESHWMQYDKVVIDYERLFDCPSLQRARIFFDFGPEDYYYGFTSTWNLSGVNVPYMM